MAAIALASTARWIAAARAHESRREDWLFHDPWAAALAGAEGEAWIASRGDTPSLQVIAIRARFFDEFLERATGGGGVRQVVLLGAGFDTRAYRLSWPAGTKLFELDRPEVLVEKEQVMRAEGARPACERHVIGADLARPFGEALDESGFRRHQPSCWLLEGFLVYLPTPTVLEVLDSVTALATPGSLVGFDLPNTITLTHAWTRAWVEMQAAQGAAFLGTMDDPRAMVAERGWTAAAVQAGDKDANYGRWPYPTIPIDVPDVPETLVRHGGKAVGSRQTGGRHVSAVRRQPTAFRSPFFVLRSPSSFSVLRSPFFVLRSSFFCVFPSSCFLSGIPSPSMKSHRYLPALLMLFIGSGCAALIYEVVWYQLLELVIGSSAVSMAVLLGTFMGGLCLGSLGLPRLVSARHHPLRVYAALEFGIGAHRPADPVPRPAPRRRLLRLGRRRDVEHRPAGRRFRAVPAAAHVPDGRDAAGARPLG